MPPLSSNGRNGASRRAAAFAADGAHVVGRGRNHQHGVEVVAGIRAAGGRADFIAVDLGSANASRDPRHERPAPSASTSMCSSTLPASFAVAPRPATDEGTFDQVYAVNVKAPFFLPPRSPPPGGSLYSSTNGRSRH